MAFPDGWGRKCEIVIDADEVDAALTDFPVLCNEDVLPSEMFDADGSNPALNGGGDIRFSSDEAGTTQLPCEVVSFVTDNDPANGTAQIWVKVPSISASVNTSFWVWYKKSGESQPSASDTYGSQNVWDSSFVGVWHLEEDPSGSAPQMLDSTANAYHATASNMESGDSISTAIGLGVQTDGSDEVIEMPSGVQTDVAASPGTVEAVVRKATSSHSLAVGFASQSSDRFALVDDGSTLYGVLGASFPSGTINDTNWHHLACRGFDDGLTNHTLHIDGGTPIQASAQRDTPDPLTNFYLGRWLGVGYVRGEYTEVRVSNVARATAWIDATHSTCLTPATFALAGTPEDAGGGTTYDETGAGALTIGGSAAVQVTYSPAASGGAALGGSALPQVTSSQIGAGGIVAGGAADVQATYSPAAAGGVVLAGAGQVQAVFGPEAAGGVVIGGAAELGASEYSETGSGGAVLGGSSLVQGTYGIEASGGAVVGGTALLGNQEFSEVASGGAVLGGAAGVQQTSSLAGSGGAVLSGTAAIEYVANVLASGGAVISGVSIVAAEYGIVGEGGVVLGGTAIVGAGEVLITRFHPLRCSSGVRASIRGLTGTQPAIRSTSGLRVSLKGQP